MNGTALTATMGLNKRFFLQMWQVCLCTRKRLLIYKIYKAYNLFKSTTYSRHFLVEDHPLFLLTIDSHLKAFYAG